MLAGYGFAMGEKHRHDRPGMRQRQSSQPPVACNGGSSPTRLTHSAIA
jgi:hypothetical protein